MLRETRYPIAWKSPFRIMLIICVVCRQNLYSNIYGIIIINGDTTLSKDASLLHKIYFYRSLSSVVNPASETLADQRF